MIDLNDATASCSWTHLLEAATENAVTDFEIEFCDSLHEKLARFSALAAAVSPLPREEAPPFLTTHTRPYPISLPPCPIFVHTHTSQRLPSRRPRPRK